MPKVVICVVPGWAAGGGHSLHVVCDLTLASAEHARFKQTDADVASFDGGFGSAYLARQVGQKFAREIFFLGREYSADDYHRMGAVNAVVPHADLEATALEWAAAINAKSPTAQRMLKYSFNLIDDGLVGQQLFAGEATRLAYATRRGRRGPRRRSSRSGRRTGPASRTTSDGDHATDRHDPAVILVDDPGRPRLAPFGLTDRQLRRQGRRSRVVPGRGRPRDRARALAAGCRPVAALVDPDRPAAGGGRARHDRVRAPATPCAAPSRASASCSRCWRCSSGRRPPTSTACRRPPRAGSSSSQAVDNPSNVGAIVRNAAALGWDGLVLDDGERLPDRRSVC